MYPIGLSDRWTDSLKIISLQPVKKNQGMNLMGLNSPWADSLEILYLRPVKRIAKDEPKWDFVPLCTTINHHWWCLQSNASSTPENTLNTLKKFQQEKLEVVDLKKVTMKLSNCLESNQYIEDNRWNIKNGHPHHDLPETCGRIKSICKVWIRPTDNVIAHLRTSFSINDADPISMIYTRQQPTKEVLNKDLGG